MILRFIDDVPHLVLSDFGCALTKGSWLVHYNNDSVDLGGNLALRAPEVCFHSVLRVTVFQKLESVCRFGTLSAHLSFLPDVKYS